MCRVSEDGDRTSPQAANDLGNDEHKGDTCSQNELFQGLGLFLFLLGEALLEIYRGLDWHRCAKVVELLAKHCLSFCFFVYTVLLCHICNVNVFLTSVSD